MRPDERDTTSVEKKTKTKKTQVRIKCLINQSPDQRGNNRALIANLPAVQWYLLQCPCITGTLRSSTKTPPETSFSTT